MTIRGVADHPNKELMQTLWEEGKRASEILDILEEQGLPLVSYSTLARYGQRYWDCATKFQFTSDNPEMEQLAEVLNSAVEIGNIRKVAITTKRYPGWEKIDGVNVQVEKEATTHTVEVTPTSHLGPKLVQADIGPFKIKIPKTEKAKKPKGWHLAVSLPDTQTGYFQDPQGELHTIHDEAALDIAYQLLGRLEALYSVDLIVNHGDDLDLAEFSSHRSLGGYKGLLQLNINRYATHLAIEREIAPNATIVQLHGNHEARLEKYLTDKASDLLGITRAFESEPVLALSHLCRYEDYGIETTDPYPHGVYWASPSLRFIHGVASGAPGVAATKNHQALQFTSTIFGHDHKQSLACATVDVGSEHKIVYSGSPGCLCRVDGLVPSSHGGIGSTGKPTSREKWQQGVFIIWYEPENLQRVHVEPVLINKGHALFRGESFRSTVDPNGRPCDE